MFTPFNNIVSQKQQLASSHTHHKASKGLQLYLDRPHFVEMQEYGDWVYSITYLFASFMAKTNELLELQVKFILKKRL